MKKLICIWILVFSFITANLAYANHYYTKEYPVDNYSGCDRVIEIYKNGKLYAIIYKTSSGAVTVIEVKK